MPRNVHRRKLYPQKGTVPLVTLSWYRINFITIIEVSQEIVNICLYNFLIIFVKKLVLQFSKLSIIIGWSRVHPCAFVFANAQLAFM